MEICGCPQQGTKTCRNCDENPMAQIKNLTEVKSEKSEYNTSNKHIIADLYKCNTSKIKDNKYFVSHLITACAQASLIVVDYSTHISDNFNNGIVLFENGHMAFHCNSELGYIAFDFYSYENVDYSDLIEYIRADMECGSIQVQEISRGYLNII